MRYFQIDLNTVLRIKALYFENLTPPRGHCARFASEYILYAVTDGELWLEDGGQTVNLQAGDIYMFKKGDFHRPVKSTSCSYIYVHFESDKVKEIKMNDKQHRQIVGRKCSAPCEDEYLYVCIPQKIHIGDVATFNHIVSELKKIYISPSSRRGAECLAISFTFARILTEVESIAVSDVSVGSVKTNEGIYRTVKSIADYIESNYASDFSRRDIEERFYLNFDYANRIFKKYMGQSISKYKNTVRIRVAKNMMTTSSKSFGKIAEEVGFRDRYYFSRVFKQLEGVTPTEYIKRFMFASGEITEN